MKTATRSLWHKLAIPVIASVIALALPPSVANAQPGTSLGTVILPGNGSCSVGGSFDGTYYITVNTSSCSGSVIGIYQPPPTGAGPATLVATKTVLDGVNPVNISAVDWDSSRNMLWGVYGAQNGDAWLIDLGDKTLSGNAPATHAFDYSVPDPFELVDGLAWDFTDDTIWISPDVNCDVWHFEPDGTPLGSIRPENAAGEEDCVVSGVAIGSSNTLYIARNGTGEIRRVNKSNGNFVSGFTTTNFRVEDLTCDSTTYAPKEAVLAKDAFGSSYEAFEVEPGTCPQVAEPEPTADKEVTDVILDDGSGFDANEEGPALQRGPPSPLARTTTYRMNVELATNPIISVVSLERNNGPDATDSNITFLASIDDGQAPGHVGGAYIKDRGSPRGNTPDFLTCFSTFNPDNPLEQRLNPCPTEEKIPGDGFDFTAESDLHFQMTQEAQSRERILRFFKLHCLVVGQHTITFYNKVEVIEPTVDPDLTNNWWRAILEINCVIRSTPGKVTGGGYIEVPPDGGGGGGGGIGLAEMTIVDGVNAGVGGKANFGFNITLDADDTVPTGNLLFHDHEADVRIKSTSYDGLVIACPHATFTGTADVDGVSKQYQVDVDDIDEPGSSPGVGPDTFTIRVLDGSYMATGPLVGGNIQVHKPPECG